MEDVVSAIIKTARTGNLGDGHVLVLPVEHRYNIRNGDRDVSEAYWAAECRRDIDAVMAGNLCRCMTYVRIRSAIKQAAAQPQKVAADE